ncbi:hypothetical protein QAD02_022790 [Eretmocerus hayati]|uniref:Uncharacterized protein n=1 Tax=Eretmocerus hayati TaxID=131215 RepID=A0ACC2PW34_9HYME|nr:hypothetical protein QAD02_022790 [Eretmocerus hayati]
MIILLVWIFFSLLAFHLCTHFNKAGRLINKIPGPTVVPLIGNLLHLNVPEGKVYKLVGRIADEFYPIFRFWFPSFPMVFIRHPNDMSEILSSKVNINKGSAYDNMRHCGNDGLIFSGGEKWYHRRKLLNPAFSPNMLKVSSAIVSEHAEKLTQYLESQGDESVQELMPLFLRLTLDIICETGMGINLDECSIPGAEEQREAIDFALDVTAYRTLRPYVTDFMMKFLPMGRKQSRLLKEGRKFRNEVIDIRRKHYQQNGYEGLKKSIENDDVGFYSGRQGRKGLSVIDILLSAERDGLIDSKGVDEEVETFIAAGSGTTALTMIYLLLQLSENQEAQTLARAEANEILAQCGGKLTVSDVKKMDYIDRCIKESMRILPTVPKLNRVLNKEAKLSGYVVPPKSEVVMLIHETHRDPNYWPDPQKFDPDRFLPENTKNRHPYAYVPFSTGPRQCIAYKYALITVKILLSRILNKFKLEPVQRVADVDFRITLDLRPTKPVYVKFIRVKDSQ